MHPSSKTFIVGSSTIPLADMRRLIAQGLAEPLLSTSAPPVRIRGEWWAIPQESTSQAYVRVEDAHANAELEDLARRLRLANAR